MANNPTISTESVSPPPTAGNLSVPPASSNIVAGINSILSASQADNAKYLQTIARMPPYQPRTNSATKRLIQSSEKRTIASLVDQAAGLGNFPEDVIREIKLQERKGGRSNIPKAVKTVSTRYRREFPLIAPILNKQAQGMIAELLTNHPELDRTTPASYSAEVQRALAGWSDIFTPEEQAELEQTITHHLEQDSHLNPNHTPAETIQRILSIAAVQNGAKHNLQLDQITARAQQTAQTLHAPSLQYQQYTYHNKPPEQRQFVGNVDPFHGLGKKSSRIYSAKTGFLRTFARNGTIQRLSDTLGTEDIDNLIKQHAPDTDLNSLSTRDRHSLVRQWLYLGAISYEVGMDSKEYDRAVKSISSLPRWAQDPRNPEYFAKLHEYKTGRQVFDQLKEAHPDKVSRYTSFWSAANRLKYSPYKLDPLGLRYRIPHITGLAGEKWHNITEPIARVIYAPAAALSNLTYKYNPLYKVSEFVSNRVKDLRRVAGTAILRVGEKLVIRAGARKGLTLLAGKLLIKLGAGIAGIETGGIATVIAILSIAYDLYKAVGGWRGLLRLAFYGLIARFAILALLLAKFQGFFAAIWSTIQAMLTSWVFWAGASALAFLAAPALAIAGIPLFLIFGAVSALVALASYLPTIIAFITANIAALSAAIATAFSASATSTILLGTSLAVVGGVGGGYMLTDAAIAEILTLRIDPIINPIEDACWPVSGRIWQDQHGNVCGGGRQVHASPSGTAVDIAATEGDPVRAMADGVVVIADTKDDGGYGLYVMINYPSIGSVIYAHLSQVDVAVGQNIKRGDVIGLIGSTGHSTGPHLHIELSGGDVANILPPGSGLCDNVNVSCLSNAETSPQ